MSFAAAVKATPGLGPKALKKGLQALASADRQRIRCANPRRLCGSINLDSALRFFQPNAHRWDYALCHGRGGQVVHWIEVHPTSGIRDVEAKLAWLKTWLRTDGRRLAALDSRYVWIPSGEMTFTLRSPQIRRLATLGVQTCARVLDLP